MIGLHIWIYVIANVMAKENERHAHDTQVVTLVEQVQWALNGCYNILFSSGTSEDAVYMESDEHRKEYVLEDFGFIWKGVSTDVSPSPWAFDQVLVS